MSEIKEPILHTHATDCLPEAHPLAWQHIYCTWCGGLVHASNNECMSPWLETGVGPICLQCVMARYAPTVDEPFKDVEIEELAVIET